MSSYVSPGLTIGPPGAPTPPAWNRNAKPGELAAPLANDAGVNAAYQALMGWLGQADLQRGEFSRQLTDNLALSQQNRTKAQAAAHQALADRGLLNSGAALSGDADIMSQYDRMDTGLRSGYDTAINDLGFKTTGLTDAYENAQIAASGNWTREQAQAAADAMEAARSQSLIEQQTQMLMAALAPPPQPVQAPPPVPTPYVPPKPKQYIPPPPVPSGSTGYLLQKKIQGPQ